MASKMPRGLVALSASAVAGIYFAGYLTTQAADSRLVEPTIQPQVALSAPAAAPATAVPTPFVVGRPARGASTSSATAPAVTSAPAAASSSATAGPTYRDGVYQGSGTSRRGGVSVAVTIQGARITNVAFTGVTTEYPVSRIAGLPAQVVSRQSVQVDRISGATYSVQAFQQAVQQAPAQAIVGGTGVTS